MLQAALGGSGNVQTADSDLQCSLCTRILFDCQFVSHLWQRIIIKVQTRRWHVMISCRQPDGRPPQPVRPWKSGRVHLAEGSNVVVLKLPYSTEFGRESRKFASGVQKMENLMTVVDRLDELEASSVGRRECSSTRQRTGARRMNVHVDT